MTEQGAVDERRAEFYGALLEYRDRLRATYVPSHDDMLAAFGAVPASDDDADHWECGWLIWAEDVTELWERYGADAVPYLRVMWENTDDFNGNARGRAMSYLLSPKSTDLNPLVPFLVDFGNREVSYSADVPVDWVMRNRDALREVWIYQRIQNPDMERGHGLRAARKTVVRALLLRNYIYELRDLDVDELDVRCGLLAEVCVACPDRLDEDESIALADVLHDAYRVLVNAGVPAPYSRLEVVYGYPKDANGIPILGGFDVAETVAEWQRYLDMGVPEALAYALVGMVPVADAMEALDTFRSLNADGAFPFALAAAGLGVEEDVLTDDEWDAWCANS